METTTAEKIAARNDRIRAMLPMTHRDDRFVATAGLVALGGGAVAEALGKVANFSEFTEDNNPHQERDFGAFTLSSGERCFWKIDDYRGHDGIRCVLTILLAEEW